MDHDFEMTLQYAKDRIAFGRPIGSFQARQAPARRHQPGAGDEQGGRAGRGPHASVPTTSYGPQAASMAKAFVGDAGVELAQNCFQVFGGIGYTWEHDQHLYLRRITTDAGLFGDAAWHREHLCQLAGL